MCNYDTYNYDGVHKDVNNDDIDEGDDNNFGLFMIQFCLFTKGQILSTKLLVLEGT